MKNYFHALLFLKFENNLKKNFEYTSRDKENKLMKKQISYIAKYSHY